MKNIILLVFVIWGINASAKPLVDSARKFRPTMVRTLLNPKNKKFNPKKAFLFVERFAIKGDAEALNLLGTFYIKGTGTAVSFNDAYRCYTEAAKKNCGNGWYNLATMFKNGDGVKQDFTKAYAYYQKGAALNDEQSYYGAGYMNFKGLGCEQDYDKAVKFFKKGAYQGEEASCYMLGICFRNGYGITANIDSAKFWLTQAANQNDSRAIEELQNSSPENLNITNVSGLQPANNSMGERVDLKKGYKKILHHVNKSDLKGKYDGYVIKFDWSGKHIIGQKKLHLDLSAKNNRLTGSWEEEDQEPVTITGELTDTAIVFNNITSARFDHYNKKAPLTVQFNYSRLNLVKNRDTVFISGNVSFYSPQTKEPEKPQFIMLIRTDITKNPTETRSPAIDSLHFIAYPNPFTGPVNLKYTLKENARVQIVITDVLSGRTLYKGAILSQSVGEHTETVSFNASPGNYVITLIYGNKNKSLIVYKQ
jgi:hypothetical protein